MKILIAIDSFKGSLSSKAAGDAVKRGVSRALPDALVTVKELADGGEGTLPVIARALGAETRTLSVCSPLPDRRVEAPYGVSGQNAVIEIARAAGLPLLSPAEQNPMYTTTRGVGELIVHAMEKGCRNFIVGLGGSATNDCGIGMLRALGYSFTDRNGNETPEGGRGLENIVKISGDSVHPLLKECRFTAACDVNNPLFGERGASRVFAGQKGAAEEDIDRMDRWIKGFSEKADEFSGSSHANTPGSGAAGGMGYAFLTFLNARIVPGAQTVLETTGIAGLVESADVVVTGEGRLDGQSVDGKAPLTLARLAKERGKTVLGFCGILGDGAEACRPYLDGIYPIKEEGITLEQSMDPGHAAARLETVSKAVFEKFSR